MRYELSCIIKSGLGEEKTKETTQGLVDFVSGIGEDVKIIIPPKAQALAYPIKKQTQGFWTTLELNLEEEKISELEKKLKDTKEIIRFMITKKPLEKKKSPHRRPAEEAGKEAEGKKAETKEEQKPSPPQKAKREDRVEIKDLDKKLDEILGKI